MEDFTFGPSPQQISLQGSFIYPSWATESLMILRLIIDDFDTPYKYTDDRLIKLLLTAGQLMQTELRFPQSYTIDVNNSLLSPDPTLAATRDDGFINLMVLKAACLLASAGIVKGSNQAIDIQSNKDRINLSKKLDGAIASIKSFCDAYNAAKIQYINSAGIAGQAIIGPYRVFINRTTAGQYFSDRLVRGLY